MEFERELAATESPIDGLYVVDLSVHGDDRGWFKENWQKAKMEAAGLPSFNPVQNNISFNADRGVTRGIHAEPWDKFISVACGSVFGAWVDLRPGKGFGTVFTCVIDPSVAVFVPRGVGNAFQALEDGTAYTYLVNAHWSAELKKTYTFVNLADPELAIQWPIPLEQCTLSEADQHHPFLADALAMGPRRTLVTGCNGQLGQAVRALAEERGLAGSFDYCDIDTFDMSDPAAYDGVDWDLYGTVINCGAYTAVDAAETEEGRRTCWAANAQGPALLAATCAARGITLVHVSSDYVFDGVEELHGEDEPFGPLGVYGQSKAAGDLAVAVAPAYYILRSSWVVGRGKNFVRTMVALSDRVADGDDALERVTVVDDQIGALTFTDDMARAIFWLLGYREGDVEPSEPAPFGTYNLTGAGEAASWAEIARTVFEVRNGNGSAVVPVTTEAYYEGAKGPVAPRPHFSGLDLAKIRGTGFEPEPWRDTLAAYMEEL